MRVCVSSRVSLRPARRTVSDAGPAGASVAAVGAVRALSLNRSSIDSAKIRMFPRSRNYPANFESSEALIFFRSVRWPLVDTSLLPYERGWLFRSLKRIRREVISLRRSSSTPRDRVLGSTEGSFPIVGRRALYRSFVPSQLRSPGL